MNEVKGEKNIRFDMNMHKMIDRYAKYFFPMEAVSSSKVKPT